MKSTSLRDSFWSVILPLATAIVVGLVHQGMPGASSAAPIGAGPTPSATPSHPSPTWTPSATRAAAVLTPSATPTPSPRATSGAMPTAGSSALDAWVFLPVSKDGGVPATYAPTDLVQLGDLGIPTCQNQPMRMREQAAMALADMFDAARQSGHELWVCSAYRSYAEQVAVYGQWVEDELRKAKDAGTPISREEAESRANRYSALPGYSEHQLGTTVDISSRDVGFDLVESFGRTPGGRWLAQNAHLYGFVFSYPDGKEELTGYVPEPWHLRWIGRSAALDLFRTNYLDPSTRATLTAFLKDMGTPKNTP